MVGRCRARVEYSRGVAYGECHHRASMCECAFFLGGFVLVVVSTRATGRGGA